MRSIFYPKSVVVFGVSQSPTNLAGIIIENLDRFGYRGSVYAVGVSGGFRGERQIYQSIEEIGEAPELAVLLIPARYVPGTLDACGKKGVRSVILESSGFSELSDDSKDMEQEIRDIAARWNMRIVGPNCFGAINMDNGLMLPFFNIRTEYIKKGGVSLVSQSGGIVFDACMFSFHEKVGFAKLISVGNKLMTNENDCLEYLIADENTTVIGLYLESFSDGRRFMDLVYSTEKPVVVLKSNRGHSSRQVAKFHTAALAGDDAVADAAMRQAGVHRVRSMREMIDLFKIFQLPRLRGPRIAVITRSGGHGVLAADAVERYGLQLSHYSDKFFDTVKTMKANVIRTTNPLDIGDVYDGDSFRDIINKAIDEESADGVMANMTFTNTKEASGVAQLIRNMEKSLPTSTKPVLLCLPSNKYQVLRMKDMPNYPFFSDVDDSLSALARSYGHTVQLAHRDGGITPQWGTSTGQKPAFFEKSAEVLMEPQAIFETFRHYDIPVADYAAVTNREEAISAAAGIGYPVALKVASPEVLHKTEQGGVKLGLTDADALEKALIAMPCGPYLVQKMSSPGHEVIIGAKRDAEFGHILLFGLGGIFAELFRDTAIRVTPIDERTAMEMIDEIKGAAMLKGFRGRPPADLEALVKVITNISRLLTDHPEIAFIDVNPLIVFDNGQGCLVVDAKAQYNVTT